MKAKHRPNEGLRTSPKLIAELRRISKRSNGVLIPESVVEAARPPRSVLHGMFCWEDSVAAHQYRLWQARAIIRTTVHFIHVRGDKRPVRVFVSLTPDRGKKEGGYRQLTAVLDDHAMRRQLLEDALDDLVIFERKYAHLCELADVFAASKRVREELSAAWADRAAA